MAPAPIRHSFTPNHAAAQAARAERTPLAPTRPSSEPARLRAARTWTGQGTLTAPPQRPSPRIVFLLMSAVAPSATVDQLAHALGPHPVLVHHDFSQSPDFMLQAPNVQFVSEPVRTGWAQFGFVDGIFRGLQHALGQIEFDYLQLLSPSCLPIRPMAQFERHVSGPHDAHFDAIDLRLDSDARVSVGYRAWTCEGSLAHRLARRLVRVYYGDSPGRREQAGIWLRTGHSSSPWARLAGLPLQAMTQLALAPRVAGLRLPLHYGSVWFGARRPVIEALVRAYGRAGLREHFARMHIAEEFLLPSLLMRLGVRRGPMNHRVQRFEGAHPGLFQAEHLDALRQCGAWFARKFPVEPQAAVRQQVLRELAGTAHDRILCGSAA